MTYNVLSRLQCSHREEEGGDGAFSGLQLAFASYRSTKPTVPYDKNEASSHQHQLHDFDETSQRARLIIHHEQ